MNRILRLELEEREVASELLSAPDYRLVANLRNAGTWGIHALEIVTVATAVQRLLMMTLLFCHARLKVVRKFAHLILGSDSKEYLS